MNPIIICALADWKLINAGSKQWAKFEAILFPNGLLSVRLKIGDILSGGFKETAIVTREYYQASNGVVTFRITNHL